MTASSENAKTKNDDVWFEKYSPIVNPQGQGGYGVGDNQYMFETYGTDFQAIQDATKKDPRCVWTLVVGDEGSYISSGIHRINAEGFFITEKPCESEFEEYVMDFFDDDEDEDEDEDE